MREVGFYRRVQFACLIKSVKIEMELKV